MGSNLLWRENKIIRKYRHRKLPSRTSTRIIELLPAADPSEDFQCRIRLVELGDAEKTFDAVSYAWGDASFCRSLYVIGDEVDNTFPAPHRIRVTSNLDEVLHRFRQSTQPARSESDSDSESDASCSSTASRSLWVDGVCIDQHNMQEKAHHITLMASIYSMAARVLIWLGDNAVAQEAVRLLRQQPLAFDDVPCVQSSLLAPWFSRRWVIQEAVLNPEAAIFCGTSSTKFDLFCRRLLDLQQSPRHSRTTTADITRRLTAVDSISMLRKFRYGNPLIRKTRRQHHGSHDGF